MTTAVVALVLTALVQSAAAQTVSSSDTQQQIAKLKDAMSAAQAQIQDAQKQLLDMQQQIMALEERVASEKGATQSPAIEPATQTASTASAATTASQQSIDDIRDRQDLQESEITTQEQTKVESESKFPVKISGLLLLNGFVNTRAVDMAQTPTVAVGGAGSTGLTLRQTILGFDARGPHLLGARSYANLRVDFNGVSSQTSNAAAYTGYYNGNTAFLRLRTAHAGLKWSSTEAFFSLDRPIISPETPTSLTAVAEPGLAWAGNLWTWNPQVGVAQDLHLGRSSALVVQGALIDVGDAPATANPLAAIGSPFNASTAESSRWPGLEGSITFLNTNRREEGTHFGGGWYFAPHLTPTGQRFNAWAGTAFGNVNLPLKLRLTSSFYRGVALGGLGGGGFKDYGYRLSINNDGYAFRPLGDIGGWAQLKEKVNERLEFNAAFGLDNVFADHFRYYAVPNGTIYQNLARNRAYTANAIYSPSAYLMFSIEYRHLQSYPILGSGTSSDVVGLGAGYRF
jgi:hypothetical protein